MESQRSPLAVLLSTSSFCSFKRRNFMNFRNFYWLKLTLCVEYQGRNDSSLFYHWNFEKRKLLSGFLKLKNPLPNESIISIFVKQLLVQSIFTHIRNKVRFSLFPRSNSLLQLIKHTAIINFFLISPYYR